MQHLNNRVFDCQVSSYRYNQFFNPNICHVCKLRGTGNLISCDKCCLISYCTVNHKSYHTEHNEICQLVSEFLLRKPKEDTSKFANLQEWIQTRKQLLTSILNNCRLKMYEMQMIMWSKSCIVCHQQANLWTCEKCLSANYCSEHADAFRTEHSKDECNRLTILLNTDIVKTSDTVEISYNFLMHVGPQTSIINKYQFFEDYIKNPRLMYWTAEDYILMDFLSGPMTIYFGLSRLNLLDIVKGPECIIHVIAANSIDRNGVGAWEFLFHRQPQLRTLIIIMIGPELEADIGEIIICNLCTEMNRNLIFLSIPMLYHDYVQSPTYKIPNIIVGLQAEFNVGDTWSESIKTIQTQSCPLLLVSSSERKAHNNLNKIQQVLSTHIAPIFCGESDFSSDAPYRDLETGYTYYRNQRLAVYKNLCDCDYNEPCTSTSP